MNSEALYPGVDPLEKMKYKVVGPRSSFSRALRLLKMLKRDVPAGPHILGFGCFWSHDNEVPESEITSSYPKGKRKVAVLSLASFNERVLIIRLLNILELKDKSNSCKRFLKTLKKLLASTNIPKVGFRLKTDATYIEDDFKLEENPDFRFYLNGFVENTIFTRSPSYRPHSLDYCSNLIFSSNLDPNFSRGDWEGTGKYLPAELVSHAAKDAILALQVFLSFAKRQIAVEKIKQLTGRKICKLLGGQDFIIHSQSKGIGKPK